MSRAVMQQALEALEIGYDSAKAEADQFHSAMAGYKPQRHAQMDADVQTIAKAITAIKQALAEPEQPVAWVFRYSDGSFDQPSLTEHSSGMIPLYTAPTPRKPEQKVWCACGDSIQPDSGAKCGNCVAGDSAEPEQEMPSDTRYTVAVEGKAPTYWDCIHDAMTNAQRAVYSGVDSTTRAIDDLKAGRIAEWSYGFSAVRIYPPQSKAAPTPRKPVGQLQEEAYGRGQVLWFKKPADQSMLYTDPPQRKPVELTDEELEPLMDAVQCYDIGNSDLLDFARAVIAAYQKKQGGQHE